jgi:hypothetical protein
LGTIQHILKKSLKIPQGQSESVYSLIRIKTTEEYFYFPHLVVVGRYCECKILIANPIDWLYAACLEYFIFFSIDSSEASRYFLDTIQHILKKSLKIPQGQSESVYSFCHVHRLLFAWLTDNIHHIVF